jgi:hypothetical protein
MIAIIAFHDDRIEPRSQPWPLVLATVATLGEVLMGLIFVAAAGPVSGAASVAAATLVSPWYLWSSASAMVALLLWIPLDRGRRALLLSLTLSGVVAPWVRTDPTVGAALMASAMALTFGILYWFVLRTPSPSPEIGPVVRWVSIAYVATAAAGFGSAVTGGSDAALIGFGLVMTAVMVGELRYLLTEGLGRGPPALGPVDAALSASRASPAP